jgi:hypothetical protein
MKIDEIKKLGRDAIINLAVEKLNQQFTEAGVSDFNPANFDRIKVKINENSVSVSFGMVYRYIPLDSAFYYGVFINLTENLISYDLLANPKDNNHPGKPKFFTPTLESDKAIFFILDASNKSFEVDPIIDGQLPDDTTITIYETPDHYDIEVNSEYVVSNFKINKISGEIYDATHEHIEPEPF